MKILVATEKPFAPVAVQGIREVIEGAGHELVLVEKGTRDDMIKAIADCAGLIVRSDKVDKEVFDAAPQPVQVMTTSTWPRLPPTACA